MIDDAIRRNRRRIVALCTGSLVNWWLLTGVGSWLLLWRHEGAEPADLTFQVATSVALGTIVAVLTLAFQLWSVGPRTIRHIGAVSLAPTELPVVHNLLAELAIAVGIGAPDAAVRTDPAPNALAVGTDPRRTTIVVTTGLVESLTRDELESVLAAELWAIRRLDTAMQTVAVACAGSAISFHHLWRGELRAWFLATLTWPSMLVAELLRRAVHRNADFGADELAVATTRHPDALRRALAKLRDDPSVVRTTDRRLAPLWFEPLRHDDEQRARELRRFVLSPTLDERLARLPG